MNRFQTIICQQQKVPQGIYFIYVACCIALLAFSAFAADNTDKKLVVRNNSNLSLNVFVSDCSDTASLGRYIGIIMAGNVINLPFPENWELYVRRIKQAKVTFVKKTDGRNYAVGSKQQIVKQLLLSKRSLDSLGWVITIP